MKTATPQPGINIEGEVEENNKPGRKWTARLDNVRQWTVGSLRIAWETSGTRDDWRMSTALMMVMTKRNAGNRDLHSVKSTLQHF